MRTSATIALLILLAVGFLGLTVAQTPQKQPAKETKETTVSDFKKPDLSELKKKLDPLQFAVTQQCGTEPPFRNAYWNNKKPGIYVDVISGQPLFSSQDKFDSGSGWPSFTKPIATTEIVKKADVTHGMERVEVRSKTADSHLGHVFEDGPAPSGLRYCINSASLRFIPVEKMEEEGYGNLLEPFVKAGIFKKASGAITEASSSAAPGSAVTETATLAGGCFWGMEEIIRKIPGVTETSVGYIGGKTKNPTYKEVCSGETGHAEAVQITFNPAKISYAEILGYFFKMHDPTTLNRQHNDVGTQYRSAIFYHSEEQRKTAEEVKAKVNKSGKWKQPIVTEIVQASTYYPAEGYHQDYLQRNPSGYNCHYLRD